MAFVKSVFAGLVAMVITSVGAALLFSIVLGVKSRNLPDNESYGWDPITLVRHSIVTQMILVAAFAAGFIWQYRRAIRLR